MTPLEFAQLLKPRNRGSVYTAVDGLRLADAVSGLNEAQRKKLSKTAKSFWRQATAGISISREEEIAVLGVLATGSLADAGKLHVTFFKCQEDAAIKILIDRRPEWIENWVDRKLDGPYYDRISWKLLRALICAGVCRKPDSPGYAMLMAHFMGRSDGAQVRISERLMAEPDLLSDVWRFFEQDICPFYEGDQWSQVLGELAGQGLIDRGRLLDSALQTLFHDNRKEVHTGYICFYRSLNPTADERVARQPVYLELLSHRVSHVVGFALEELGQLDKQDALDGEAFFGAGKSVFALKPKGQSLSALRLARGAAKRRAELIPLATGFALDALTHDSADVQQQALGLLQTWQNRLHRDHLAEIREHLPGLAATARKQAVALVESAGRETASPTTIREQQPLDVSILRARAEKLERKWRSLAGVDEALSAFDQGQLPAPLTFRQLDVPVLSGAKSIVPIQSLDELLDATAHAIEVIEDGELERILDGISRLCDRFSVDFERRAAPLMARMEKVPEQDAYRGLRNPYFVPKGVRRLILSWLSDQPREPANWRGAEHALHCFPGLASFIDERAEEIHCRMEGRRSAPMLSAPTHQFGWVEPREFVRRLSECTSNGEIPVSDLIQALLRLAPDGRELALADAKDLPGDAGRAVRWALGGAEGPKADDKRSFAMWLAAAQARNPDGELKELADIVEANEREMALWPPTYIWTPFQAHGGGYSPGGAVDLQVVLDTCAVRSDEMHLRPTFALSEHAHRHYLSFGPPWAGAWLNSIWPLNCDPLLAAGAKVLSQRVNAPASSLEPNYVYLFPLLQPDRPWSELAYLNCWIALVSKDADSRSTAIDAMIVAIDDGRADGELAADVLIRLLPGGWVKLNRVAQTLQEISRVSPLHSWWTADLLQEIVAGISEFPNDMRHILALLVELLTDLGQNLLEPTRVQLMSLKLRGKAAKLQDQLAKLNFSALSVSSTAAFGRALENRIARVNRWSQSVSSAKAINSLDS
jgi:hypothetical protein